MVAGLVVDAEKDIFLIPYRKIRSQECRSLAAGRTTPPRIEQKLRTARSDGSS